MFVKLFYANACASKCIRVTVDLHNVTGLGRVSVLSSLQLKIRVPRAAFKTKRSPLRSDIPPVYVKYFVIEQSATNAGTFYV
jgi:hypothetical protein